MDDLKEKTGYCKLKQEATNRTVWWTGFGRGYLSSDRLQDEWMNDVFIYIYSEDRASWYILIIKSARCTNFSNLFWNGTVHVSDRFSVHKQESSTVYTATGVCHTVLDPCLWTENLSETCRVPFQNKFEKLVHLAGFIIRMMSYRKTEL